MTSSIQLWGGNIEEQHCCFENNDGVLTLASRAETYVNGVTVPAEGVQLSHGDRIIISNSHFFHLHHPGDVKRQSSLKVFRLTVLIEMNGTFEYLFKGP